MSIVDLIIDMQTSHFQNSRSQDEPQPCCNWSQAYGYITSLLPTYTTDLHMQVNILNQDTAMWAGLVWCYPS